MRNGAAQVFKGPYVGIWYWYDLTVNFKLGLEETNKAHKIFNKNILVTTVLGIALQSGRIVFCAFNCPFEHLNQVPYCPSLFWNMMFGRDERCVDGINLLHFTFQVVYIHKAICIQTTYWMKNMKVGFDIHDVFFHLKVGCLLQLCIVVYDKIVASSHALSDSWHVVPCQCQPLTRHMLFVMVVIPFLVLWNTISVSGREHRQCISHDSKEIPTFTPRNCTPDLQPKLLWQADDFECSLDLIWQWWWCWCVGLIDFVDSLNSYGLLDFFLRAMGLE